MFLLNTLKARLIALTGMSMLSFLFLSVFSYLSLTDMDELSQIKYEIKTIETTILNLRRNEKDFLSRKNLKYQEKFHKNYQQLVLDIKKASAEFEKHNIEKKTLVSLQDIVDLYSNNFNHLVSLQKTIGLHPKDGLYGSLRASVHNLEDLLKNESNYKLQADMLMLRRAEKDFMLRSDLKYLKKFDKSIAVFLKDAKKTNLLNHDKIITFLNDYKKDFYGLVNGYKKMGLTPKDSALGELRSTIHKSDVLINELLTTTDLILNEKRNSIHTIMITSFILLLVLVGLFSYIISRSINTQIEKISKSIDIITKNRDVSCEIEVDGKSEISILAQNLNKMFHELRDVIKDAKKSSTENSSISHELSTSSLQVGRNVESSVVIINEATDKTSKITDSIMHFIDDSKQNKEKMIEAIGKPCLVNNIEFISAGSAAQYIVNQEIYNDLILENKISSDTDFFPLYRFHND